MYIHIHTYTHTHIHTYIHTYIDIYIYVCTAIASCRAPIGIIRLCVNVEEAAHGADHEALGSLLLQLLIGFRVWGLGFRVCVGFRVWVGLHTVYRV